jgi:tryptophan synthase alpha chain
MNLFEQKLATLKAEKKMGLMTHVVIGYPSLADTVLLVKTMEKAGVDIVELQIPFSDPLADGPTIMRACEQSLEKGTRVKDAFVVMKELTGQVTIPLLFMAYYNTVFKYGVEQFCLDAKDAGAAGLIIPDMPLEEESEEHFIENCKKYGLYHIRVLSPASTVDRIKKNAAIANGFIYCTARQGITGAQNKLAPDLAVYLDTVKKHTKIPLAVGFGISRKEHIEALQGHAEIAVVGSAVIDVINKAQKKTVQSEVKAFISSLVV